MARHLIPIGIAVSAFLLAGCSVNSSGKEVSCDYYQESANILLKESIEAEVIANTSYATADQELASNLKIRWSQRVLEAPEGCFPKSDIDRAKNG